ncbi:MAG: ornithine carbamoyltransferase [Candidatus Eisenbacteria bacterium]
MTTKTRTHHYLSVCDFSAEDTWELLRTAAEFKRAPIYRPRHGPLAQQTLAMIFEKPSLRTRVSFETGMTQLGGHAIYLGPGDIKLGVRETTEDIALTLSRMADMIMARVFKHETVVELAKYATVPVINALSDLEHPCQALGDMQTIVEREGKLEGLKVAFVGDGNNVANSLLLAGGLMGMHVTVISPPGFEPAGEVLERANRLGKDSGGSAKSTTDVDAIKGMDVVYTDVWASMGQESEAEARKSAFRPYQVNEALMKKARPNATLLHCLPAHYGEEIDYHTSRRKGSAIFDQAENRLHAEKALMVRLAHKD